MSESRPAPVDVTEEEKPKLSAAELDASADRLSNADYWLKRNKSPKYSARQAELKKQEEKKREARLAAAPPSSSADWIASKANPRSPVKKFTEQVAEKQAEENRAREAKLNASPPESVVSWVDNQQPKSPGNKPYDSTAKESERQKQQQDLLNRKPPEQTLEWCEKQAQPPKPRKKHADLVREQEEADAKQRERKLKAQPKGSTTTWIQEKSAPVERMNTTLREWPEWGKDPKWNKPKKQ